VEAHYKLSDTEFENQFKACRIDPMIFSHEAHFRLAWIHINKYGMMQALENIQPQLKSFVAFIGSKDKYNTTLTIAGISAVNHFIQRSHSSNFKDFIKEFPRLKNNFKALIKSHYSFDVFNSKKAKRKYLQPDIQPF
jgi:hypothetical protein